MKKIVMSILKCIVFFLGWAILCAVIPLSKSDNPALWRLWAEITPLFAIILFTLIFWLIDKKTVKLNLFGNLIESIIIGVGSGILWLGITVIIMLFIDVIHFESKNNISLIYVWLFSAFLNTIMQELLVRGYLYQMIKQKHNIIIAIIVTTLLFTVLHGGVFEAGVIPVLNVISMSILMIVVLEYTGSLVAPIIMHFIWNGFGGIILGGVSLASDYPHLFNITFNGNIIISGGDFKIEGSVIVFVVNILLITFFGILHHRQQEIIK